MSKYFALCATVALALSTSAFADPGVFSINSFTSRSDGTGIEDFQISNYVWGTQDSIDPFDNMIPEGFFITVTSGASMRPGFEYEITFDYSEYDIGFFVGASGPGVHTLFLDDVKVPGAAGLPISAVAAKDFNGQPIGIVSTDGLSISFEATPAAILASGNLVTIQFSQIPEPMSLSLLAMGSLALIRRKR